MMKVNTGKHFRGIQKEVFIIFPFLKTLDLQHKHDFTATNIIYCKNMNERLQNDGDNLKFIRNVFPSSKALLHCAGLALLLVLLFFSALQRVCKV